MNTETKQIYYGQDEIEAAKARGEKLIELSPGVLKGLMQQGYIPIQKFEDVMADRLKALEARRR